MANEFKIRKGLIVEGASGGTVVDVQGSQGQLFSVTDDLSGSIFAVSDISGVPILDINSSGISYFDGSVGIGIDNPNSKLHVLDGVAGTYTPDSESDTLVIESDTPGGISLIGTGAGSNSKQSIVFGTTSDVTSARIIYNSNDSVLSIGTTTASNYLKLLSGNGVTALTLDASQNAIFTGDVGIGITNPYSVLDVNSAISSSSVDVITLTQATNGNDKPAASFGLSIQNGGETTNAADLWFTTATGGSLTEKMRISSAGAIKFNAYGAGTLVSDASGNITVSSGGGAGGPYLPLAGGTMTGNVIFPGEEANSFKIAFTGASASSGISTVDQSGAGLYIGANSRVNNSGNVVYHDSALPSSGIYFDGWNGDDMEFYTGSSGNPTKRLTIEAGGNAIFTGNVGINVTNPGVKLQLVSADEQLTNFSSSVADQLAYSQINASTSTSGTITGAAALELVGKANASGHGRHAWIGAEGTSNTTLLTKLKFKVRGQTASGYDWAGAAEAPTIMTLEGDGNVGIGTTDPPQKLSLFAGTNESVYDVLGVYNSVTGTTAMNKGAAIRIGKDIDGNYSTKIATIYEGNNPSFLQPALAFYTMHNTYLKDSETEKMRISSNGNVGIGFTAPGSTPLSTMKLSVDGNVYFSGDLGIGTTSPGAPLSVVGSYSSSDEIIEIGGGTGANTDFKLKIGAVDQDYIWFQSVKPGDNYYDLVFNPSGGNVGIGYATPNYSLEIESNNSAGRARVYADGNGAVFSANGDVQFFTNNAAYATSFYSANKGSVNMRILDNGNVGIGTTSPGAKLEVHKDTPYGAYGPTPAQLNLRNTSTEGTAGFIQLSAYYGNGGASDYYQVGGMGGGKETAAGSGWGGYLSFWTTSDGTAGAASGMFEHMRITADGNVGIGTTTPNAKLDVQGTQGQLFSVTDDLSGDIFSVADISGVPIMNVNSDGTSYFDGNVGIGTDSPDSKLDVKGPSATPADGNQTLSITNSTGGTQLNLGTAENSYGWIEAREGSTLRNLLINPNGGNVGIGVTNPVAALNIGNNGNIRIDGNTSGGGIYASSNGSNNTFSLTRQDGVNVGDLSISGYSGVGITGGRTSSPATSGYSFYVKSDGNVGIGTASPDYKLEVNGTLGVNRTDGIIFAGSAGSGYGNKITADASNDLIFSTSLPSAPYTVSQRMRIANNGDIGIGGNAPSYLLDVRDGTASGAIARFSSINAHVIIESSTAGPAVLHFKPNATGNKSGQFKVTAGNGYNFRWSNDAAGTSEVTYMTLDTSTTGGGDLTVKGDVIAYGSPSDVRLKENIKPIKSALDKVRKTTRRNI